MERNGDGERVGEREKGDGGKRQRQIERNGDGERESKMEERDKKWGREI